jgi:hypothetical protein
MVELDLPLPQVSASLAGWGQDTVFPFARKLSCQGFPLLSPCRSLALCRLLAIVGQEGTT